MPTNYMKNLNEERVKLFGENTALQEDAAKAKRKLTAEEQRTWDERNAKVDELDSTIQQLLDVEKREKEAAEARAAWEGIRAPQDGEPGAGGNEEARSQEASFLKFVRGEDRSKGFDMDFRSVAAEKKLIRAGASGTELRAILQESVSTAGGALLPTTFIRRLYDFLEWYTGVRQLNVNVVTTSSGEPLAFPKATLHGTAAEVGEGTALAENDPQFNTLTLHAWKYGELSQVSNELITDSGIDVLAFIAQDAARAIGRVTDVAYVSGSGTNAPTGLTTVAGTGATAATGGTGVPTYPGLVDLVYSVNPLYRQHGAQWFMLDKTAAAIRKLTDSQNRPLWEPSLQVGEPDRLIGYPVILDPNMPAPTTAAHTAIISFGDHSPFYIRDVGMLRFERSDEFAFSSDLVTFRTIIRTDSNLIDLTGAFKLMITPTT